MHPNLSSGMWLNRRQEAPVTPDGDEPGLALAVPPAVVEAIAKATAARLAERDAAVAGARERVAANSKRLTLTRAEAAAALGVSGDHFKRHVLPDLRIVRSGRLRLIPLPELERWVEQHAARALEDE